MTSMSTTPGTANFNPRTREGCDTGRSRITATDILISIHAPVKGATETHHGYRYAGQISIHAPVKGATDIGVGKTKLFELFQSTHP